MSKLCSVEVWRGSSQIFHSAFSSSAEPAVDRWMKKIIGGTDQITPCKKSYIFQYTSLNEISDGQELWRNIWCFSLFWYIMKSDHMPIFYPRGLGSIPSPDPHLHHSRDPFMEIKIIHSVFKACHSHAIKILKKYCCNYDSNYCNHNKERVK